MTGADIQAKLRADVLYLARDALDGRDPNPDSDGIVDVVACRALAALDGITVALTAEEAALVKSVVGLPPGPSISWPNHHKALALLTPEGSDDD